MWMLEISMMYGAVTRLAFEDHKKALAEQDRLRELMGKDIYERNSEKSEKTCTIRSEHETCVVSMQNVQAVSVVDPVEFAKAQKSLTAWKDAERRREFELDCRTMKEYGIRS